jgi:hypothetical protein
MSTPPSAPQSQKRASVEGETAVPETLPATGVSGPTVAPDPILRGDRFALQVWLICTLLLWLMGLCSVLAGLSQ